MDTLKLKQQIQQEEELEFESDYQEIIKGVIKRGHRNLLVECYVNNKKIDISVWRMLMSDDRLLRKCNQKVKNMFDGDIELIRKGSGDFYDTLINDEKYKYIDGVTLVNKKSTMNFRKFFINKELSISVNVLHIDDGEESNDNQMP